MSGKRASRWWFVMAALAGSSNAGCGPEGAKAKYGERATGALTAVSVVMVGDTGGGSVPLIQELCGARDGVSIKGIYVEAWGRFMKAASGDGEFPVQLNKGDCAMVPHDFVRYDDRMDYESLQKLLVQVTAEAAGEVGTDSFVVEFDHSNDK